MSDMKDTLEMAFKNPREQILHKIRKFTTLAKHNELRMGVMHKLQYPTVFRDTISKAQKVGMKYAALVGATLTTKPDCKIAWCVGMTRPPSAMSCVLPSFVLPQCAPGAPDLLPM